MSKKILKSDIEKVQKLQKDLGEAEEIIHDRITYIWNSEWCFEYGEFPTAWLFEDFEDELCEGVFLYTQQKAAKKLKAEQKKLKAKKDKENMKVLAAAAKKKLSKEELKALGVK